MNKSKMKIIVKNICLTVIFLLITGNLIARERNLLEKSITKDELAGVLAKGLEWVPVPAYSDRRAWDTMFADVRPAVIKSGEDALKFKWEIIKATDYLEFERSGNRSVMEGLFFARINALNALANAELAEGKGRFLEALINGVWTVCEQSTWAYSATLYVGGNTRLGLPDFARPVVDLGAADIGAQLSWIHFYFAQAFDSIHPQVSKTIRHNIRTRILEPYYEHEYFWWLGFDGRRVNNWNPWINHNVMLCILLIETDSAKRIENIYKTMRSLDKFINSNHDDGGCDEGPGYWNFAGGRMFQALELLHYATGGKVNIFDNEVIKNIGRFIYRASIGNLYYVNFADAGPRNRPDGNLVFRYGKAIGDETMMAFGAFLGNRNKSYNNPFDAADIASVEGRQPFIGECWLPDVQVAVARDKEGSSNGFFLAAKGGNNNESHNHNDVGSCIVYYNGKPALIDAGVGVYSRQTFSHERYTIWTMQSGYHNLPVINGVEQKNGGEYAARNANFKANAKTVEFSVDIAAAYPPAASVKTWIRTYKLLRGKSLTIGDRYELNENRGGNALHFLTACAVSTAKPGVAILEGEGFTLEMLYDASKISLRTENIKITDRNLNRVWGNNLTRIVMDISDKKPSGSNRITLTTNH
ncbi:MAG: heparinase II/III-family protein [Prevotellaceae bacterium]|jgi:hypothetical protein|nr:heparinase II/III-family protein [Prevotellaceae bacterium]